MKLFKKAAVIGALALIYTIPAFAQSTSYGGYGGYGSPSPSQSIMVDKLVSNSSVSASTDANSVSFVDNLSSSDHRFAPNDMLMFKIRVKNTSDSKLTGVTAQDLVPSGIEPQNGVSGYTISNRTVSITVGDLNGFEEKDYVIPMQIVSTDKLPADQSVICLVNKAQAMTTKVFDEDSTQFCIEKQILGTSTITSTPTPTPTATMTPSPTPTTTPGPTATPAPNVTIVPRTGPEYGMVVAAVEVIGVAAGLVLRKKVS